MTDVTEPSLMAIEAEIYCLIKDDNVLYKNPKELIDAAQGYQAIAWAQLFIGPKSSKKKPPNWPYSEGKWRPSDDPEQNLARSAAMLALAMKYINQAS